MSGSVRVTPAEMLEQAEYYEQQGATGDEAVRRAVQDSLREIGYFD